MAASSFGQWNRSGIGWPSGWWDNHNMLVLTTNNGFVLYDVPTKTTAPFLGAGQIAEFLRENQLSEDPAKTRTFFSWNGPENALCLTDTDNRWLAEESFLVKVERPDGRLRLLSRGFRFEWSDHLDPTERYHLYTGREAGEGSNGVFVRDLQRGTNRVLVAPDSSKCFSLPRFYGDSVIYVRSNMLWRIGLDGSNNIRLFPPPESVLVPHFHRNGSGIERSAFLRGRWCHVRHRRILR